MTCFLRLLSALFLLAAASLSSASAATIELDDGDQPETKRVAGGHVSARIM